MKLSKTGIVLGTELFSNSVGEYNLQPDGSIAFDVQPPEGTKISYINNLSPYYLTCSEVGAITLMDSSLKTTAVCPDGSLVLQVRAIVQQILTDDRCYWGL